jgi:hypothetical protein
MKTIKLAYDAEGTYHNWTAYRDDTNGGWVVTDHQGDKKFYDGCFDAVLDRMTQIVLPNWGMRLIAVR